MTELMNLSDYQARKADLARAADLAATDVQSATFRASTGSGTPEDVQTAKGHLAAIESEQADLEALWEGTQAEAARQYDAGRDRKFAAVLADIEGQLAKRELAVKAVASAADTLVKAIVQYREGSDAIRDCTAPIRGNAGAASQNAMLQLSQVLENRVAEVTMSVILNTARIGIVTAERLKEAFGDASPVEQEAKMAGRVRSALQQFAPRKIGDA
jgi:lactate dehydrogenase-like 2-hydroxyacid dehydrogenase